VSILAVERRRRHARPRSEGFTLIEVMAALAILGGAMMLLLDSHYEAMKLHVATRDAVEMDNLMALAVGLAETELAAGKKDGADDFGPRYPGYSYAFSGEQIKEKGMESVMLFNAMVRVTGPEDSREMSMMFYMVGTPGGSGTRQTLSGQSGTGRSITGQSNKGSSGKDRSGKGQSSTGRSNSGASKE
jgi:prepilin-type N-terminal cleavage/methylation domain-containing protein